MIKLSDAIQKKLLSLPESGMGYQVVEATYSDRNRRECIVLNATVAEPTNGRTVGSVIESLSLSEAERIIKFAAASTEIVDVQLKSDKGIFKGSVTRLSEAKGADKASEELTKKDEKFVRFSAFENDLRIDRVNKRVLPGTYATTLEDARFCVQNRINPVARYALPSPREVKYAFHISPLERTPIKRGTVEPANNQPGGGAEVIFTKGTDNNTVSLPPESL
jgi:hypothetical protein